MELCIVSIPHIPPPIYTPCGKPKKKNKETKKRSTQSSGVVVINFFTLSLHNKSKAICTNTIYAALTQVLKSKTKKIKKKEKKEKKK